MIAYVSNQKYGKPEMANLEYYNRSTREMWAFHFTNKKCTKKVIFRVIPKEDFWKYTAPIYVISKGSRKIPPIKDWNRVGKITLAMNMKIKPQWWRRLLCRN